MLHKPPLILGIGGTLRQGSSSERALQMALLAAEQAGAKVKAFTGVKLDFPHYDSGNKVAIEAASELIALYRECDGVIIASGLSRRPSGRLHCLCVWLASNRFYLGCTSRSGTCVAWMADATRRHHKFITNEF